MTNSKMEQRDEIIDQVRCGTEIAADAAEHGYTPKAIRDNGRTGDAKVVLYDCAGTEAMDTNGGAHWSEQHDGEEWAALVAEMVDGRTVTYTIRRPGCSAWTTGVRAEDLDDELRAANDVVAGHIAVLDDAR